MIVKASVDYKMKRMFDRIDRAIDKGMDIGAKSIAETLVIISREQLAERVAATNGKWTGNLSNAIQLVTYGTSIVGYKRYDLKVDTGIAPYAIWIDRGHNAGEFMPYAKAGGRDYSNSKFKGHRYLSDAVQFIKKDGYATLITANSILHEIKKFSR